ncbi:hypothetical protein SASPL_150845 [Salvia splendens]|uniref:RING-type E3 ubiquitin transferase n=1 Tax=Salvia splendens TaxID=180675 RepID=A0A8X8W6T6_SALSN|nr:hypothetical protein SASPL_150845 [Salvia splendens]
MFLCITKECHKRYRFWIPDVATMINKAAPDFCSVYVISRGKAQSIRPAARHTDSSTRAPSPVSSTRRSSDEHSENGSRRLRNDGGESRRRPRNTESSTAIDRLKQEVNQTMSMYNEACKEAISAQKMVNELQQQKHGEIDRFGQARQAEEAALALVEMEKVKCRAAIEAAEKAQKIAEKETQRRRYAEQRAKKEAEEKKRALNALSNNDDRYRRYVIEEIEEATNKFSGSRKIGEGGYGPVYKGS